MAKAIVRDEEGNEFEAEIIQEIEEDLDDVEAEEQKSENGIRSLGNKVKTWVKNHKVISITAVTGGVVAIGAAIGKYIHDAKASQDELDEADEDDYELDELTRLEDGSCDIDEKSENIDE